MGALVTGIIGVAVERVTGSSPEGPIPAGEEATPSDSQPEVTQVSLYRPHNDGEVNPELVVDQTLKGQCQLPSNANDGNPEAFRCVARSESGIPWDPCFILSGGLDRSVICIDTPWSTSVTLMHVKRFPDERNDLDRSELPWAVELSNGYHCLVRSHGTAEPGPGGEYPSYFCGRLSDFQDDEAYSKWLGETDLPAIYESIDGSHRLWRASFSSGGFEPARWVAITQVWY